MLRSGLLMLTMAGCGSDLPLSVYVPMFLVVTLLLYPVLFFLTPRSCSSGDCLVDVILFPMPVRVIL